MFLILLLTTLGLAAGGWISVVIIGRAVVCRDERRDRTWIVGGGFIGGGSSCNKVTCELHIESSTYLIEVSSFGSSEL